MDVKTDSHGAKVVGYGVILRRPFKGFKMRAYLSSPVHPIKTPEDARKAFLQEAGPAGFVADDILVTEPIYDYRLKETSRNIVIEGGG